MTAGHENLSILRPLLIVNEREVKKYPIKKYPKGKGDLCKEFNFRMWEQGWTLTSRTIEIKRASII